MGSCARTGCAAGARGPARGEKLWAFHDAQDEAPFGGSPALAGGRVYVGSDNRKLYCLDARTGQAVWEFKAACEVFASPVVADGRVFAAEGLHESKASKLYCLDAATGVPEWSFPTASHIEFSPTLLDGRLYVGSMNRLFFCLGEEKP
jgi:outer membrane protein assembly factor BamB